MSDDSPMVQELRTQLKAMAEENQALRVGITQRDRWIGELRDAVAALTKPDASADFTLSAPTPAKSQNYLHNAAD